MDTDIYSPIHVRHGEIRLLLLAPGAPHDQITGALVHTTVNHRGQEYEALSYTWGSSEFKAPITINDRPCLVNTNLLAALIELRSEGEERTLWIDAICINQDDIVEKGVHVPLMHHIYHNASRVIVWLGCASDDSDQAFLHTDMLLQERSVDGFVDRLARSGTAAAEPKSSGNIWRPLAGFFNRPWWMRMWVAQEIFYGASKAIVMCGGTSRPWENIMATCVILAKDFDYIVEMAPQMPSTVLAGVASPSAAYELFNILIFDSLTLEYALEMVARVRYATDARDKIYALLNLLPAGERPCKADYSIDVNVLYTKVASHIIRKSGSLNILSSCVTSEWIHSDLHMREGFKMTTPLQGLPSWVPDWTVPRITVPCTSVLGTQSHDHLRLLRSPDPLPFRLEGDQVLVVRGIVRESIVAISHVPMLPKATSLFDHPDLKTLMDYVRWHIATVGASCSSCRSDMQCTAMDAEWNLLTGDNTRSSHLLGYSKLDYTCWRRTGSPLPSPEFKKLALRRLVGRRVSSTSGGLLALVPWGAKIQDCVSLVAKCHVPMLLRPILQAAGNEKGRDPARLPCYQVIGDTYVQGYKIEDILQLSDTETGSAQELRLM